MADTANHPERRWAKVTIKYAYEDLRQSLTFMDALQAWLQTITVVDCKEPEWERSHGG